MFTYERNGKNHELAYNPELLGFMYAHCKCSFVKFKRTVGDIETQLSFYPEKQKIQVDVLTRQGNHSRHESGNTIMQYPTSQESLTKILSDNGII